MECLRSMCGVTRMDRVRNKVVRDSGCAVKIEWQSRSKGVEVVWAC